MNVHDTAAARGRGYAGVTSVAAGQPLRLHLARTDATVAHGPPPAGALPGPAPLLELQRIGASNEAPVCRWQQPLAAAPLPGPRPWEGLDWPVSVEIATEPHWPSGLYGVHAPGGADWLCVVVRAPVPRQRLLVAVDFLTPQAYCATGGKSLYGYNSGGQPAHCVGLDRPEALPYPEIRLARWLDRRGLLADWCCTLDLATHPGLLQTHDCLVVGGHFEYWTGAMREALAGFVRRGGRLVVLSGNTGYRRVRWDAARRQVHYWQRPDLDPCEQEDDLAVAFSEPPLAQPVNALLGGGWGCGAYGAPDGQRSAYTCLLPDHWVFDGVWREGTEGPRRTAAFMHYETDAVDLQLQPHGHALATGRDAAPLATVVLAQADLRHWARPGWATMSLTHVGRGRVFHAGSTDWLDALDEGDEQLSRITLNVLQRFLDRSPGWLPGRWSEGESIGRLPGAGLLVAGPRQLLHLAPDGTLQCRDALPATLAWQPAGRLPWAGAGLCHDGHRWWALDAAGVLWLCDAAAAPGHAAAWRPLAGGGPAGRPLCALPQCLYAVDEDGTLWCRPTVAEPAVPWRRLPMRGLAGRVVALALRDHHLLVCTTAQRGALLEGRQGTGLWRHDAGFIEDSAAWVPLRTWDGAGWSALALVDDMLYAADADGGLHWLPSAAAIGRQGLLDSQHRRPGAPLP